MASSSAAVIIHPVVNSSVFRFEDRDSRCLIRSWLAPAPSTRTMALRRNRDGTCFRASASTSLWSVNVFDPALPGLSFMARHSRVFRHQAPNGWKPYPFFQVGAAPCLSERAVIRVASMSMTTQPSRALPATDSHGNPAPVAAISPHACALAFVGARFAS